MYLMMMDAISPFEFPVLRPRCPRRDVAHCRAPPVASGRCEADVGAAEDDK